MDEAPRSKLRGILRNSPKPLPSFAKATEGSPRLHPRSKLRGIQRRRILRAESERKAEAPLRQHSDEPKGAGRWLVVWSLDDVVFKPGAALGEQPIGEHFSRPLDG